MVSVRVCARACACAWMAVVGPKTYREVSCSEEARCILHSSGLHSHPHAEEYPEDPYACTAAADG